jgi:ketosteroid isomerase-like protein
MDRHDLRHRTCGPQLAGTCKCGDGDVTPPRRFGGPARWCLRVMVRKGSWRQNENESLIRAAYGAYARGDVVRLLDFVDPDLEWTYLDPNLDDPSHRPVRATANSRRRCSVWPNEACKHTLRRSTAAAGGVMVVIHTSGVDAYRVRHADDRNSVFTLRRRRIVVQLRDEALRYAGIG